MKYLVAQYHNLYVYYIDNNVTRIFNDKNKAIKYCNKLNNEMMEINKCSFNALHSPYEVQELKEGD